MIVSGFFILLGGIITALNFILPTGTFLPANFSDLIEDALYYAYGLDWLFPVDAIISAVGILVIFFAVEFVWRGSKYLLQLVRGN